MARRSLASIAHDIDPDRRVGDLTRTEKSLVAIARALGVDARVLVLDEPTASLPQEEVQVLFRVLRSLKSSGVGMIYVSHRLDEIFAISDRLAVLRDGSWWTTRARATPSQTDLIHTIIGRPPEKLFVRPERPDAAPALSFRTCRHAAMSARSTSMSTRGEIVALVGLRGAGQERIGRALIGASAPCVRRIVLSGGKPDTSGRARRSPRASPSCRATGSGNRLPTA